MNYMDLRLCDASNGDGFGVTLFVSGCTMHCKGCFNKESWSFKAGKKFTEKEQFAIVDQMKKDYISHFSILGGDPLEASNVCTVTLLCEVVKTLTGKPIWLWTGRKYDKAMSILKESGLEQYIDYLVCEPFIEKFKCNNRYYGSSNQAVYKKEKDKWIKTNL